MMMDVSKISFFEICRKSEDGTEFRVRFDSVEDALEAVERLSRVAAAYELRHIIYRLRNLCQTLDGRVFCPKSDVDLPKARWMTVAAASSFPRGVPMQTVVENSDLTLKSINAYCTSKNNPTHEYLDIEGDMVYITPEGIRWVVALLEKDCQIERIEEAIE